MGDTGLVGTRSFRIRRYAHVSPSKYRRLLEESLIPILDDSIHKLPDIQNYLSEGDWLVEFAGLEAPVKCYRFKQYRHKPHLHLYIKHYAEADVAFELDITGLSGEALKLLELADHLEILPPEISDRLIEYNESLSVDLDEKMKQLVHKLKTKRNVLTPLGKMTLTEIENGSLSLEKLKNTLVHTPQDVMDAVKRQHPEDTEDFWRKFSVTLGNAQWEHREKLLFDLDAYNEFIKNKDRKNTAVSKPPEKDLVDPKTVTGAISKAILEGYMKTHNGELPTKKQFEKLKKRGISYSGRRRRK